MPLTIRSVVGAGGRFGAIHSQMPVSWFMGVPGLKIVTPSTPADAKALLKAAIRDDNPVLFFEHKRLYALEGEVNGEVGRLGEAAVVREGSDLTLVSAMQSVHHGLEAAEALEQDGVSVEVIDLRTLRPFDLDTVVASVRKTNRIVVVEEGPLTGGWAGEVLASVTEHALGYLDDAWRIATPNTSHSLQPTARGRVSPRAGPHRSRDPQTATVRAMAVARDFEPSKIGGRLRAEAREARDQPPRARAPRRCLAEPRLADRARPGEPVGQHPRIRS